MLQKNKMLVSPSGQPAEMSSYNDGGEKKHKEELFELIIQIIIGRGNIVPPVTARQHNEVVNMNSEKQPTRRLYYYLKGATPLVVAAGLLDYVGEIIMSK